MEVGGRTASNQKIHFNYELIFYISVFPSGWGFKKSENTVKWS